MILLVMKTASGDKVSPPASLTGRDRKSARPFEHRSFRRCEYNHDLMVGEGQRWTRKKVERDRGAKGQRWIWTEVETDRGRRGKR